MIQLETLGAIDLRRETVAIRSVLQQPKRLAVLVYLASASPRGFHSRDTLLALFWSELDQERARNALRQTLHYLRRSLGDDVVVGRGDREVGIDEGMLRCDAAEFDRAIAEGRHEEALAIYQGEFLPGFFIEDAPELERWVEEERVRRRRAAVAAARALAQREEARGELRAASLWARRALSLEPYDEAALRELAGLLERAGEHAAALESIADFARRLEQEYGLALSVETVQLGERLRAARGAAPAPASRGETTTAPGSPAAASLPGSPPAMRPAALPVQVAARSTTALSAARPPTGIEADSRGGPATAAELPAADCCVPVPAPTAASAARAGTGSPAHAIQLLFAELRRRRVLRVMLGYSAGAIVVLEGISLITPVLPIPDWVYPLAVITAVVGLPFVLFLAWLFDITPRGLRRTRPKGVPGRLALHARLALLAVSIPVLLGGGMYLFGHRGQPVAVAADTATPTIAVLPFVNTSSSAEQEYFSDGLTDELLNLLAQAPGLRVAARSSSFSFKGKNVTVDSVGRALHVAHVLEGSVRRFSDRVRIHAQLSNTRDGYQLWSQTYDREIRDIFAVQEEIARAIAAALEVRLGTGAGGALARRPVDPAAYDLYLRGKHLVSFTSEERNRSAIAYFEQAVARDPEFAAAYAALAQALIYMGEFVPPREVLPRARLAALRALELDSTLVETRLALAGVRQVYERDWAGAEREIRRAIQLDSASADAHAAYAQFLLDSRRFEEAMAERRRSWDIRRAESPEASLPSFQAEQDISWALYYLRIGRTDQALRHATAALELDPDSPLAYWPMALTLQLMGRDADAVTYLERAMDLNPGTLPFLTHLGRAYGRAGRKAEALAILDTLESRARRQYVPKDQLALLHLGLGDRDRALDLLEQAGDDYHWWLPRANEHPIWHELRHEPRFQALMRRLGAPPPPAAAN